MDGASRERWSLPSQRIAQETADTGFIAAADHARNGGHRAQGRNQAIPNNIGILHFVHLATVNPACSCVTSHMAAPATRSSLLIDMCCNFCEVRVHWFSRVSPSLCRSCRWMCCIFLRHRCVWSTGKCHVSVYMFVNVTEVVSCVVTCFPSNLVASTPSHGAPMEDVGGQHKFNTRPCASRMGWRMAHAARNNGDTSSDTAQMFWRQNVCDSFVCAAL